MEINKKVFVAAIALSILVSAVIATGIGFYFTQIHLHYHGKIGMTFTHYSIHSRIQILDGQGNVILDEYHAGVVTNLGDNMTLYKLWGDSDHQYGSLNSSAYTPYISIGNDTGTLGAASTVLPNEWHREVATVDGEQQSQLNFSCTMSGGDIPGGSQTADCIGICLTEVDDANDLWGYDTFTQVTGIDNTFTINIDIQVSVAHS